MKPKSPYVLILFVLGMIGLIAALYLSYLAVLVSLIGLGIGILVTPLLTYARLRFRIPRPLTAFIFLILTVLFAAGICTMLGMVVSGQAQLLLNRAPGLVYNLQERFSKIFQRYSWIQTQILGLDLSQAVQVGANQILYGLKGTVTLLSGLFFAFIIGLYTAVGSQEYFEGVLNFFPPDKRERAREILSKCAYVLRMWFRAQMIDSLIIGTLTAVGLRLVHVDYWAVFGLLTAVLGIIPYVGVLIVTILVVLITLATDPWKALWAFGIVALIHQIEGNFILPRIMRDQVELLEVPLLIFMLVMGTWFGLIGVFVAPPLFAILKTLYKELYKPWIESRNSVNG